MINRRTAIVHTSCAVICMISSTVCIANDWREYIMFPRKQFFEIENTIVAIGTLTGEGIGYPNNTMKFQCTKTTRECIVATVEEIGKNQVGTIDLKSFEIVKWGDND